MFGHGTKDGAKETTSDIKERVQERYTLSRNPVAKALQVKRNKTHLPKKGKGSYRRIKWHGSD
jgi:hypothetical protein